MFNFTTNQFRNLYVAKAFKTVGVGVDPETVLTNPGDIAVIDHKDGKFHFLYRNGDGILTASDTIWNVEYKTKKTAASLATDMLKSTVTLASGVTLNDLKGKHVQVIVTLHEQIGLEYSESYPIVVDVYVNATNGANATAFYKAFEDELNGALKPFQQKPFAVTSSSAGLVIKQTEQKYVRGKLDATPINFDVRTSILDEEPWGAVAVAKSGEKVTGDYTIAALERFCLGERGDILRENAFPNNYEPTYLVNPVKGTSTYGLLTIQFYWAGVAENVQKSPRTIQIAAADSVVNSVDSAVEAIIAPAPASE